MFSLKSTSVPVRKAFLVGICWHGESRDHTVSLLDELGHLTDTLGVAEVDRLVVSCVRPQPRLLVGSGKADEIVLRARAKGADVIIFDQVISPGQQRNWEKLSRLAVIDREEVILDIFARRARTSEARLQVELARMEYSLPRLTRAWGHLSRQAGTGFGAMGAGETQLETDRRLVRHRIDRLKAALAEIRLQRAVRRKQRRRGRGGRPVPHAAIVGYTNAGKSSLFHRLTGAAALIEDKLFATLDTTTRTIELPDGQPLLLTDTVGFVRKLPHGLVESFKATLEESVLADFLIHVLDVSDPDVVEFYRTTMDVLEELGADVRRVLTVLNKSDAQSDPVRLASLRRQFPEAPLISALTGEGLDPFRTRMREMIEAPSEQGDFLLPQSRYDLVSGLHRHGRVIAQSYEGDYVRLTVRLPVHVFPRYADYLVSGKNGGGD